MDSLSVQVSGFPSKKGIRNGRTRASSGNTRRYCTINLSMPPTQPLPSPHQPSSVSETTLCPSSSGGTTLGTLSDCSELEPANTPEDISFPQPPPLTPLLRRMQSEPSLPQVDHAAVSALLAAKSSEKRVGSQISRHLAPFPEFPSTVEELDFWVGSQQAWVLNEANNNPDFSWEAQTPPLTIHTPVTPPLPRMVPVAQYRQSILNYESPLGSLSSPAVSNSWHRHSVFATDSRYVSPEPLPPVPRVPRMIRKMTSFRQTSKQDRSSYYPQQKISGHVIQQIKRPEDSPQKRRPAIRSSHQSKERITEANRLSFIDLRGNGPTERFFHRSQQSLLPPRPRPVGVYGTVQPADPHPPRRLTKGSRRNTGLDSFMDMGQESQVMTRPEKVRSMLVRASINLKRGWNKALMKQ